MSDSNKTQASAVKNVGAAAREAVAHASSTVTEMAQHAAKEVEHKADDFTGEVGGRIRDLGKQIGSQLPENGVFGGASQAFAKQIQDGGAYLQEAKFQGVVEDLSEVIQRHPIPAVLIALGLGWCLARRM